MPYYEYHCAANGRTIEVRHGMSETMRSWGEVTRRAGLDLGDTPPDTPVRRLISAPVPLTSAGADPAPRGCGAGCACYPEA